MEKRVELEKRGKNPDQVTELNLDNCKSASISGLTSEFVNLRHLSLINVGLTSLKGFPQLPNLKKLELSDNRIPSGLEYLSGCNNLTHINLSGNKIKDFETLEPLKEFNSLKSLDLFNCEITTSDEYRQKTFAQLKSLQYLDGFDKDDKEADEDEDEINGNEEDSDIDDEDLGDEDDEGEDEEDIGLEAIYKDNLEDIDDSDEFEGAEDEEDDDDDDEEAEDEAEVESPHGVKRKHEDEEGENNGE